MSRFLLFIIAVLFIACVPSKPTHAVRADTTSFVIANYNNCRSSSQLVDYYAFSVLFHEVKKLPICVSYELVSEHTDGPFSRKHLKFIPDEHIDLIQADDTDYRGSGWSRGHMAPAGDFKWTEKGMQETFFYTNCCPQNETLNNGSWHSLEKRVRYWAKKYGKIYVATGPIIGTNRFGTIGPHKVVVPDGFFKALLVCVDGKYHAIAFYMQNIPDRQSMKDCYMTIDELETLSEIDFFPFLEDIVEKMVEAEVNTSVWF